MEMGSSLISLRHKEQISEYATVEGTGAQVRLPIFASGKFLLRILSSSVNVRLSGGEDADDV